MPKISESLITKGGANTESFYDFLISKYIAPHFTFLFKACGVKNPNIITLMSVGLLLTASFMVLFIDMLGSIWYRAAIAVFIQLSFIFDCSDGQLARITGKSSKLGAWLDRLSDRLGEFIIFTFFGYTAWRVTGHIVFLYLGLVTGYGLAVFTLAMSLAESVRYDNIDSMIQIHSKQAETQKNRYIEETAGSSKKRKQDEYSGKKAGDDTEDESSSKKIDEDREDGPSVGNNREETAGSQGNRVKRKIVEIAPKIFFFLNFGIGERYLYLSFFIIILRPDIMLYISSFLTVLRCLSISHFIGRKIKKTDRELADVDEASS